MKFYKLERWSQECLDVVVENCQHIIRSHSLGVKYIERVQLSINTSK